MTDNGLPPDGTDINDNNINFVSIAATELSKNDISSVVSALVNYNELKEEEEHWHISSAVINKSSSGDNMLFIYYL